MAILPIIFLIQPLVQVFAVPSSASGQLTGHHELLYLLLVLNRLGWRATSAMFDRERLITGTR
jgi:hypothetical protein